MIERVSAFTRFHRDRLFSAWEQPESSLGVPPMATGGTRGTPVLRMDSPPHLRCDTLHP
jgi:hypothetical protein